MAAGAQTGGWSGPSRRRVPRFPVEEALDVTVLRSGIPDTVPGRSVNICERGIGAILAGELMPGESVGLEVKLSAVANPLRARAMVRYQDKLRCGLEFMGLSAEQRSAIREWAKGSKAESSTPGAVSVVAKQTIAAAREPSANPTVAASGKPGRKNPRRTGWIIFIVLAAVAVSAFWWRWNRAWEEMEGGLKGPQTVTAEKPQAQVPAEVMQRLLIHRVEPTYPAEARQEKLEGTIALDVIIGRDGSVISTHPLNGPEVLARAAIDALRWWKFEPYRLNGEPAIVETTVAVEFKR